MWILLLILVGVVVYLVVRRNDTSSRGDPAGDPAMDILRQRYARGEISREEFEERKRELDG